MKKLVTKLSVVAIAMFGFGYLLVPLYSVFCEVTGINGKGYEVTESGSTRFLDVDPDHEVDESRTVTVEFMSSINSALNWEFRPAQNEMKVHPGQATVATYIAKNLSDHAVTGQAVPSVAPAQASLSFEKIECFCFTEQTLQPGEEREMPVRFVVKPELPASIPRLTLAYTFYRAAGDQAAAEQHDHGAGDHGAHGGAGS